MAATPSAFLKRKDLLWAPRQLAVVQYPYTSSLITSVHNPDTGELQLPENGFPIGLHSKARGGALANAQTINDIMSHGVASPTRQIPTERRITLGLDAQETHRKNLENFFGADWSDVVPDASGGVTLPVSELPLNLLSRIVLVGKDDWNGHAWYICWILNRVNISETGDQALTDPEVALYPYTMNAQGEDDLEGTPAILDIFGPGWQMVQEKHDVGFYPPVTALNVAPTSAALTVAAGAGHTQQLAVTDSNGNDRTDTATYTSSDPAKVSASGGGLLTGVAVTGASASEVQTLTVTGTGTYTMSFKGSAPTSGIAHNAVAATIQTAVQGLSTVGSGNCTVTGATSPYTLTFAGALANQNVPQFVTNSAGLTGGSATVTTTTPGNAPTTVAVKGSGQTVTVTVTVT